MKGRVSWFDPARGLGVIVGADGRKYSVARQEVLGPIPETGQLVEFSPRGGAGQQPVAVRAEPIGEAPAMTDPAKIRRALLEESELIELGLL